MLGLKQAIGILALIHIVGSLGYLFWSSGRPGGNPDVGVGVALLVPVIAFCSLVVCSLIAWGLVHFKHELSWVYVIIIPLVVLILGFISWNVFAHFSIKKEVAQNTPAHSRASNVPVDAQAVPVLDQKGTYEGYVYIKCILQNQGEGQIFMCDIYNEITGNKEYSGEFHLNLPRTVAQSKEELTLLDWNGQRIGIADAQNSSETVVYLIKN